MKAAPTWIDAGLAYEWQSGRPARYDRTLRWFVSLDQSRTAFVVMSGNAGHGSFGGEDTAYTAKEVASAIERCGTLVAGLETCPEFLEALKRDIQRAKDKGTRLEIIRAKYLLNAMRARLSLARAEDVLPFIRHAEPIHADDDKSESSALIIPWERGDAS